MMTKPRKTPHPDFRSHTLLKSAARPSSAKLRAADRDPGGSLCEPWMALGISRRDWYAHRRRYRDRYRLGG
jgi:hypothetical protein